MTVTANRYIVFLAPNPGFWSLSYGFPSPMSMSLKAIAFCSTVIIQLRFDQSDHEEVQVIIPELVGSVILLQTAYFRSNAR